MHENRKKVQNVILWIIQFILASGFIWSAAVKWFLDEKSLAVMWPWTVDHLWLVRFTGLVDLMAAFGLIIPGVFKMSRLWISLAAAGVILLMLIAGTFHLVRGEVDSIGVNITFMLLAAFVLWGRLSGK